MNQLLPRWLLLFLGVLPLARSRAEDVVGVGTRGGGQTIGGGGGAVGGGSSSAPSPVLRDFVDPSTCRWEKGRDFYAKLSYLPTIERALDAISWFYPHRLRAGAAELRVCLVEAGLRPYPGDDPDSPAGAAPEGQQSALRWDDQIYLDAKIFAQLTAEQQAYLFVHEILHSYLPMDLPQRNAKLRGVVRALRDFTQGTLSRENFLFQLPADGLRWATAPEALGELNARRADYEAALDGTRPEAWLTLWPVPDAIMDSLLPRERALPTKFIENFTRAVIAGDAVLVQRALAVRAPSPLCEAQFFPAKLARDLLFQLDRGELRQPTNHVSLMIDLGRLDLLRPYLDNCGGALGADFPEATRHAFRRRSVSALELLGTSPAFQHFDVLTLKVLQENLTDPADEPLRVAFVRAFPRLDYNAPDFAGGPLLVLAALTQQARLVEALLAVPGIDVNRVSLATKPPLNALAAALWVKNDAIAQRLREAGARANATQASESDAVFSYPTQGLTLRAGEEVRLKDIHFIYSPSGSLEVRAPRGELRWSTQSPRIDCADCVAKFQNDGNLVLYHAGQPYWSSGTYGHHEAFLRLANSPPYLSVIDVEARVLWSSGAAADPTAASTRSSTP